MPCLVEDRFREKIAIDPNGCWLWIGAKNDAGYGQIRINRITIYAHRYCYEYFNGPIPEGLELDHLCRNRACVNPAHLEPVTHQVNSKRGDCGKYLKDKDTCVNGHPFDKNNTYIRTNGHRDCRVCRVGRIRKHRSRLKQDRLFV